MVTNRWLVVGVMLLVAACGRKEGSTAVAPALGSASSAPNAAPVASSASSVAATAALQLAAPPSSNVTSEAPASFANASKETIDNAVGQGCEARSSQGWLEFLCRKKNGTGGHPVRATWPGDADSNVAAANDAGADAGAANEVVADEHGELRLTLPYRADASKDVTIEWTDTRYVLHVRGASAKLEWTSAGLELRRACAHIQEASKSRVSEAQKLGPSQAISAAEAAKLPRFGVCQQAGFGSYALGLKSIGGEGEGALRRVKIALEVIFVAENGSSRVADFGSFEFAPGGFSLAPLRVYDYDDDGKDELIVAYELTPLPTAIEVVPAAIWSLTDTALGPYPNAPGIGRAGFSIEQLDFDMRPDLGDFGPYVAALAPDCGTKTCPARVTGPRFFFHSLPDGKFARDDAAAKSALKRACPKRPEPLVAESGGALNVAQTGKNIACGLAWGVPSGSISAELADKRALFCGDAESCPLLVEFGRWAHTPPPTLVAP